MTTIRFFMILITVFISTVFVFTDSAVADWQVRTSPKVDDNDNPISGAIGNASLHYNKKNSPLYKATFICSDITEGLNGGVRVKMVVNANDSEIIFSSEDGKEQVVGKIYSTLAFGKSSSEAYFTISTDREFEILKTLFANAKREIVVTVNGTVFRLSASGSTKAANRFSRVCNSIRQPKDTPRVECEWQEGKMGNFGEMKTFSFPAGKKTHGVTSLTSGRKSVELGNLYVTVSAMVATRKKGESNVDIEVSGNDELSTKALAEDRGVIGRERVVARLKYTTGLEMQMTQINCEVKK